MAKVDWTIRDEVKPSDMNQIGQEINDLKENTEGSADWQKYKLTQDDGINKLLDVNYDLNKLFEAGVYSVPAPLNGPTVADWYYVEVFVHSVVFVMQRATLLSTTDVERDSEVYVRTTSNGSGSWRPWKRMTDFDIPDATTTQEGKVQLTADFNSTSTTLVPHAKALRDGVQSAINAAAANVSEVVVPGINATIEGLSNVYMPKFREPNIIANGSAEMWLAGWTNSDNTSKFSFSVSEVNPSISHNGATTGKSDVYLISDAEYGLGNGTYTISAEFSNSGASLLRVEVYGATSGTVAATLTANQSGSYHRKTITFTTNNTISPSGIYKVRIVAPGGTSVGTVKYIRNISMVAGNVALYNRDGNHKLMRELYLKSSLWGGI